MKNKSFLLIILGAGSMLAGPLLSQASAGDRHHRQRYHYDHGCHRSTGIVLSFNFAPSPVYRSSPRASYVNSRNLVARVQRALNRRGYPAGYVDGRFGGRTRSAIREYQYDRGLRATGTINESLLRSLGL